MNDYDPIRENEARECEESLYAGKKSEAIKVADGHAAVSLAIEAKGPIWALLPDGQLCKAWPTGRIEDYWVGAH